MVALAKNNEVFAYGDESIIEKYSWSDYDIIDSQRQFGVRDELGGIFVADNLREAISVLHSSDEYRAIVC